jgi:uncharacterized membrane protein
VCGYLFVLVVSVVAARPAYVQRRGFDLLLATAASAGFAFTLYLTVLELFVIHAMCRWCVASAVIMTAIWAIALSSVMPRRTPRTPSPRTDS